MEEGKGPRGKEAREREREEKNCSKEGDGEGPREREGRRLGRDLGRKGGGSKKGRKASGVERSNSGYIFPQLESISVDSKIVEFLPNVHYHQPSQRAYTELSTSQPESTSLLINIVSRYQSADFGKNKVL